MRLVLHAPNIHQGGGACLLTALIVADRVRVPRLVMVDARYEMPKRVSANVTVKQVSPSVIGRLRAERYLKKVAAAGDVVVCLGNLPPLFPLSARAILFLQNRLLIGDLPLKEYGVRVRLRTMVERIWLKQRLSNVQRMLVQTPTMQRAVMKNLGVAAEVMSFLPCGGLVGMTHHPVRCGSLERRYDFVYVSSGEPHKNHKPLIEAWKLLAEENLRPRLSLTLSLTRDAELCRLVDSARATHRVDVINIGTVPPERIHEVYAQAGALIYPSLLESLGLPLLEAAAAGVPILAAELDYVRDLLDPAQTFDPTSARSIARAVKRHLGIAEHKTSPLDADDFLSAILDAQVSDNAAG